MLIKPAALSKVQEWHVVLERPGKRVLSRYDAATDEVVFLEEFLDQTSLDEAAQQRELVDASMCKNMKPLAVIPQSVMAEAMRDGWANDDKKWKKWMNDIDNNKLRITTGRA